MKPRRDITLGEMQDECKRVDRKCEKCNRKISVVCGSMVNSDGYFETPKDWDLTDPPRFTEAQMALLRALRGLGFVSIENIGSGAFKTTSEDGKTGLFMKLLGLEENETLDLAELLGKDAT